MDSSSKPPTPSEPPPEDAGFDFLPTDIEDARRVLDDESIAQFEVAGKTSPEHWKRLRRAGLPSDRALTGRAIDWLLALPAGLRPQNLGARFPRIVNELAEIWDDPAGCQAAFDRLLNDGRKGRRGFPADVRAELQALRDWTQVF